MIRISFALQGSFTGSIAADMYTDEYLVDYGSDKYVYRNPHITVTLRGEFEGDDSTPPADSVVTSVEYSDASGSTSFSSIPMTYAEAIKLFSLADFLASHAREGRWFIGADAPDRALTSKFEDIANTRGGNDTLAGGAGNDRLNGGADNDLIVGGAGADMLTGGTDPDFFRYGRVSDSFGKSNDIITDFMHGEDQLQFMGIDAIPGGADNKFKLIGEDDFSKAGQLRFEHTSSGSGKPITLVELNLDRDLSPEMTIQLKGHIDLSAADFAL